MNWKTDRYFILILVCSCAGLGLGATSVMAETVLCNQGATTACLTTPSSDRVASGLSMGLMAGMGAGLTTGWQAFRNRKD